MSRPPTLTRVSLAPKRAARRGLQGVNRRAVNGEVPSLQQGVNRGAVNESPAHADSSQPRAERAARRGLQGVNRRAVNGEVLSAKSSAGCEQESCE